jgi:anti-sigma factor RsiW
LFDVFVSDELIMAFADGELDASLACRVRDAIRDDAALKRKHDIYRSTRAVLARAFDDALREPVPRRLTQAIAAHGRILSN